MASDLQGEFIKRAKRYLRYPVRTIDQVSEKLGCERHTLLRVFRKNLGIKPLEYRKLKTNGVTSFKVARAQRLLRRTDLPIDEIVHMMGYNDHSSLNRVFKPQVGTTLSKYRKRFCSRPVPKVVFEAQKLLINTDKNISQIAEQLGYEHLSGLTKLFERYIGETCVAFRQRHWGSQYFPDTVKKAKRLLVDTDLSLEQISKRLGYQNSGGLGHMIREIEGMPPGRYRIRERERLAEERKQRDVSLG